MQMFDLSGKVAIVTGGNGGIGLGMAQGLAAAGASIAVAARNQEKSQGAVEALLAAGAPRAEAFTVDVTNPDSAKAMAEATQAPISESAPKTYRLRTGTPSSTPT